MFLRVNPSRRVVSAIAAGVCAKRHAPRVGHANASSASLGKLDPTELAALRGGWYDLQTLLRGETPPARLPGLPAAADPSVPRWEPADLRVLRVERSRDFGECYLALSLSINSGFTRMRFAPIYGALPAMVWRTRSNDRF